MKLTISILVLAGLMVVAAPVLTSSAADTDDAPSAEEMKRHERYLGLKAREAELAHQQKMRELELEQRRAEIDCRRHGFAGHGKKKGGGCLLLVILVTNILLTVWVCKDMREQKIGRALWVPIVLLAGVFGAIVYAIVRHADTRARPGKAG